MSDKPRVLVCRRLTDAVHARLERDYDAEFNMEDRVFSQEELIEKCQNVDAALPCHSEQFNAHVISQLPKRFKVIANHSVGTDHCDFRSC